MLNELIVVDITYIDDELHLVVLDALPPNWETFGSILALIGWEWVPNFSELKNLIKKETCGTSAVFVGIQAMYVQYRDHQQDPPQSNSSFHGPPEVDVAEDVVTVKDRLARCLLCQIPMHLLPNPVVALFVQISIIS